MKRRYGHKGGKKAANVFHSMGKETLINIRGPFSTLVIFPQQTSTECDSCSERQETYNAM
jgi:hypothetical protein